MGLFCAKLRSGLGLVIAIVYIFYIYYKMSGGQLVEIYLYFYVQMLTQTIQLGSTGTSLETIKNITNIQCSSSILLKLLASPF